MTDHSSSLDLSSTGEDGQQMKSQVKRCFAELRSLLPHKQDKASTLSTLQTVIHHFKKIKDGSDGSCPAQKPMGSNVLQLQASEGLDSSLIGCEDEPLCIDSKFEQGDYKMVISTGTYVVEEVSKNFQQYLGYSERNIHNRPIQDLIYERDLVTFNSHLSSLKIPGVATCQQTSVQPMQKVNFFLRLWHSGFHRSRFSVFYVSAYVSTTPLETSLPSPAGPASSLGRQAAVAAGETGDGVTQAGMEQDSGSNKDQTHHFVLECSRLQSSYKSRNQTLDQSSCSFHFKHTPQGQVSFLHPYGIPLTGYLPQDVIGQPFLGFYPSEDLPQLQQLYEDVVKHPGRTVASPMLRFRAKNCDNLIVKSEMSCFINPWSKKVDFVIGQMSVIRGPQNLDVFGEFGSYKTPVETLMEQNQRKEMEDKIRNILGKALLDCGGDSGYGGSEATKPHAVQTSNVGKNSEGSGSGECDNSEGVPSSLDISQWDEQEVAKIYNSVAYLQGIQRLLTSQAVEPSSQGWPQEWGREGGSDNSDSDPRGPIPHGAHADSTSISSTSQFGEIEGNFPRPPSRNSSTKAMVWEEDHDLQPSSNPPSPMSQDEAPCTSVASLTLQNLEEHQKNMRHVYLDTILRDRDMKLLHESISARKLICSLHNRMRRRHLKRAADSPISEEEYAAGGKQPKFDEDKGAVPTPNEGTGGLRDLLEPPFRITSLDVPGTNSLLHMDQASRPQPQVSHVLQPFGTSAGFSIPTTHPITSFAPPSGEFSTNMVRAIVSSGAATLPFSRAWTFTRAEVTNTTTTSPGIYQGNSVYQAIPNLADMLDAVSSTRSTSIEHSRAGLMVFPRQPLIPNEVESMGSDLESSTHNSYQQTGTDHANLSDSESCSDVDVRQHTLPFWMEHVHMTEEKTMNYQLNLDPTVDMVKFREALYKLNQPDEVFRQVTEYELCKVDLDMEEDSDTGSLFMPWRAAEVAKKWAETGGPRLAANAASSGHSTDADDRIPASEYRPYRPARAPRRSLSHLLNLVISDSTEVSSEQAGTGDDERVMEDLTRDDEKDGSGSDASGAGSGSSKHTGSNQGSTDSSNAASKTDSANTAPSKDSSSKSSHAKSSLSGYMASVEQMSSAGDSSVEESFDPHDAYLYSNRIFRKSYGDLALLSYRIENYNSAYVIEAIRGAVQSEAIIEQLSELLELSGEPSPVEKEEKEVPVEKPKRMVDLYQEAYKHSQAKGGNGHSTTGDSGFQSGTLSHADSYSTAASSSVNKDGSSTGSGQDSAAQRGKNSSGSAQSNGSASDNGSSGESPKVDEKLPNQPGEKVCTQSVSSDQDSGNQCSQTGWSSVGSNKQWNEQVTWELEKGSTQEAGNPASSSKQRGSHIIADNLTSVEDSTNALLAVMDEALNQKLSEWDAEDKMLRRLFQNPSVDHPYLSAI